VPNNLANVEGNNANALPFHFGDGGIPSMRYQQIYAASQFPAGGVIDRIRFRQDGTAFGTAFSTGGISVQISIGYSARPVNDASPTFANTIGPGYVTVFDGLLTLSSAQSGMVPRPFDIIIDVADLFRYDPGQGDLLVDIRMRNAPRTTYFDA